MPYPSAVFLVATVLYLGIRAHYQRRRSAAAVAVDRSSRGDMALVALVGIGQVVLPLLAIVSPLLDGARYPGPAPAAAGAGALLMAAGLWLFWRSHADLGENWSVTLEMQQDHRLVSSGVYRRLRHPMYAAFFLMAIAQCLLLANWIAGPAALLAVTLLYRVRTPREEAMMLERFGDEYRRYMASTGRLWPKGGPRRA